MKAKLKKKINAFFITNFTWFGMMWYTLTMFFTKRDGHKVRYLESINKIPETLFFGTRYQKDSKIDAMQHPRRVQKMLDLGVFPHFDCEDHASYWITQIKKQNLAKKVWIGSVFYIKPDGKFAGHAVCVYQDAEHKHWWGDYNYPNKTVGKWDWTYGAAGQFNSSPYCATMFEVKRVSEDDTPIFGKIDSRTF